MRSTHEISGTLTVAGCTSHGTVGDVLHVVEVWDSPERSRRSCATWPIIDKSGMELVGAPEIGEFLLVVQPPA